ncbi:Tryptophan--tRNA ligase, mitochondrial [Madurella mycetomatis]|uniref:Small ribosomal subunit protein uS10m n=1 Tax=Madurella mycetomatis TaxID=100816 RepID=A0A175W585_9PEZI|nr:Tryptophan--tRNA ligase, mitochondrial [Madurella mycetomatis]
MNPPRLIRPLRPLIQGQLPLAIPRSAQVGISRASTQLRTNASIATEPNAAKETRTPTTAAPTETTKTEVPSPTTKVSRLPRALEALYLKPLRRQAEYGVPSCDLQLRSYSARNLEFFCDFALRAAYYLGLPAYGPVPLPRMVERWTVPKSTFIFKKSQENFERITLRRLIQIKDGHPETVQIWLAFLQKHAYYGIGMKANVWEFSKLGVGKEMDKAAEQTEKLLEDKWQHLGYLERRPEHKPRCKGEREKLPTAEDVEEYLATERRKFAGVHGRLRSFTSSRTDASHSDDAAELASKDRSPSEERVIFSGIQPTGVPHLGNYLGALREWKRMQDEASPHTKLLFSIVDLHAITVPRSREELLQYRLEMLAALLAIGLNPSRSTIFYQSSVGAHSELQWILSCTASTGYLSRMTQWKSKMQLDENASLDDSKARRALKHGLFSYPILQAADILVHRATHVPVGEDQRQHLEFARECVTNFNHTYKTDCLVAPQTLIAPSKRIMSLTDPTKKMSKSDPSPMSRILITDSPSEIQRKIQKARTDSIELVTYEPDTRPGVASLIEILSGFDAQGRSPAELAKGELKGYRSADLKAVVAKVVCDELVEVRERYLSLMGREGSLRGVAGEGAVKARGSAGETMRLVREAVGLA